jgi:hypothetical protein
MSIIDPYLRNIDKIETALIRVATRLVVENGEVIIGLLQNNQLSKGLDYKQNIVGRYKPKTMDYLNDPHTKPRTDKSVGQPYNFEWYGEMFDSMLLKANTNSKEFEIFSSTGKIKKLEDIYKTKLGTLSTQNNYMVNMEIIYPGLIDYILQELPRI